MTPKRTLPLKLRQTSARFATSVYADYTACNGHNGHFATLAVSRENVLD